MIIDIPTAEEFEYSGVVFLNLAWDSLVSLLFDLEEIEDSDDLGDDLSDRYWQSAQKPLSIALALAEQGIEFLLKSRVIRQSPFLLIARNPREWPSGCDQEDTSFASFRTIDAQDLLRVHDTVAESRLPNNLKLRYQELRRMRNRIWHTVDPTLRVSTKDVVLEILEASHNLIGKGEWFRSRRKYLQRAPTGVNISDNEIWDRLMIEADRIIDILRPSETQSLLGFSRRRRQYFCPKCRRHASKHREEIPRLAQLNPNSPGSTNLYCFVCGTKADVLRVSCKYPDCKGNVIEPPMPYVLDYDYPPEFTEFERDGKKMARMRWREEDGSVEVIEGPMRPSKCLTCWRPQDDS